jgi:hypothetical protein
MSVKAGMGNRGRQVMWLMTLSGLCASSAAILTVLFWTVLLGYVPPFI